MAETWYPLLIGGGSNLNDDSNIVIDWTNNKIYTVYFNWQGIFTSNATTGAFIAQKAISAICGISSNTSIQMPAIVMGTNGFIYVLTSQSSNPTARLSKIDPSTMSETIAVTPYAIANQIAQGYSIFNGGDWRMSAFKLNGTDYIALLLNGSQPANIEIFNAATLASVVTYNYTTNGGADVHMVAGEQPTATTQKLYLMEQDPNGDETKLAFIATTFATTPTISDTTLINLKATDIDPTWTGVFPAIDLDPASLMFNSSDNSLLFFTTKSDTPPNDARVVKLNADATVAWSISITTSVFAVGPMSFDQGAALNDLSCCTLIFNDPNSPTYFTITPATGASTTSSSIYFDGTIADNGVRRSAVWNSVRQRLAYYYEGSANTSSGWANGGWAIWGPSTDLGCCGQPPPAPPPMPPVPTLGRDAYYIERMDNRLWDNIEDAWCLDAALQYPMPQPAATITASSATGGANIATYTITNGGTGYTAPVAQVIDQNPNGGSGATLTVSISSGVIVTATPVAIGSGYLNPVVRVLDTTGTGAFIQPVVTNYVTLSTTTSVFTTTSIGDVVRMGGGKLEIVWTGLTTGTTSTCIANVLNPITAVYLDDPDNTPLPATSGNWTLTTPVSTVSGLDHLEGMSVAALADGAVVGNLTVVAGSVTLPVSASSIVVGLPFTAQLQTLYMEPPAGGGTAQTRRKDVVQTVLRVQNSALPEVGVNQPDQAAQPNNANIPWTAGPPNGMTQIRGRSVNTPPGQASPLFTGDLDITNLFGGWDARGQIAVQQKQPVPLTVLALVPYLTVGDTGG